MAVEGENPPTKSMKPRASSDHDGRRKAADVSSLGRLKKSLKALPAWLLSVVFHFLLLMFLTLVTYATAPPMEKIKSFDASPFDTKVAPEEILHMMADPSDDPVRTLAASAMAGDLAKTEKPSATPVLSEAGKYMRPEDLLVDVVVPKVSMDFVSPVASQILQGQAGFKGDVQPAQDVGEALDQLSREILTRLGRQRVVVAWLFDESESMRDDQQAVLAKFNKITDDLGARVDQMSEKRSEVEAGSDVAETDPKKRTDRRKARAETDPLRHAVIGFGEQFELMQDPTADKAKIAAAVNKLRVDTTGTENTFQAVAKTLQRYASLVGQDQQLIVVVVTDESADDYMNIEDVTAACKRLRVPVFVIGRQAMFGTDRLQYRWVDPQTRDVYWTSIRRGPETAAFETLQWDGLHPRREDQPSGFAPYDLARLTKETGGRYFILPTAENERVRQREKAYNYSAVKELAPDYEGRPAYLLRRNKSVLRSTMAQIIETTQNFGQREEFPINIQETLPAIVQATNLARERYALVVAMEKRLRALEKDRDREPERRWQANYDLMLAQLVYAQVKMIEYVALMEAWAAAIQSGKAPVPNNKPIQGRLVTWTVWHAGPPVAPTKKTEKPLAEAKRLFGIVIEKFPGTPWADLAQDLMGKGFSVMRGENVRSTIYQERAKLIPKF
ncbi:MAG: vWA domain-containing protein [Planctomycetota bacterium]